MRRSTRFMQPSPDRALVEIYSLHKHWKSPLDPRLMYFNQYQEKYSDPLLEVDFNTLIKCHRIFTHPLVLHGNFNRECSLSQLLIQYDHHFSQDSLIYPNSVGRCLYAWKFPSSPCRGGSVRWFLIPIDIDPSAMPNCHRAFPISISIVSNQCDSIFFLINVVSKVYQKATTGFVTMISNSRQKPRGQCRGRATFIRKH
jgi:hypothetical protein